MVTSYGHSDYLRALRSRAVEEGRPLACVWEVTRGCNLDCRHCYHPSHQPEEGELQTERAVEFLEELAAEGFLLLLLTGGEPFTRNDIWDLLEAASMKEFAFRVMTNGTGLEREDIERLAELSPLSVDLSIYGQRRVHDDVTRVPGSFRASCRTGRLLTQSGVRVTVKMPLMRNNVGEYRAVKEVADSWGADLVTDAGIFCRLDGDTAPLEMQASEDQLIDFMVRRAQESSPYAAASNVHDRPANSPMCSAGRSSLYVSSTGKVYPCAVWREELGDLSTQALAEVLGSAAVKRVRELTVSDLTECGSCRLARWCVRCPGLAWLETGDELGKSPTSCRLAALGRETQQRAGSGPGSESYL
jgi:radical SAM protein with 4Fe4S-binding SPASM domain